MALEGGGGGEEETGTEDAPTAGDTSADDGAPEDAVAAMDAATEADRNATVASSGMMNGDDASGSLDVDSTSALFGDAAPDEGAAVPPSSSPTGDGASVPAFEDSTSFSTEGTPDFGENAADFGEDLTEEGQYSDFAQNDETEFSTFQGEQRTDNGKEIFDTEGDISGDSEESIFQKLWHFFTDDN